jgi:alpha-1,6-mannosyltransferase
VLGATVALGIALAATAPWSGRAGLFLALALVQAAAVALFAWPAARAGLPEGRRALTLLVVASALVRAPLLLAPPTLSDDVHRYVADGRLWGDGIDAWRTPPAHEPKVAAAPVNHPHLATIYPPFAEAVFTTLAATGAGPRGFRTFFALCDLATAAFLGLLLLHRGRSPWLAALFALHPLSALESAGSGHAEALALAALALAFERATAGRRGPSVLAFAAAAGVKPIALLAAPFLARRWGAGRTVVALTLALGQYAVLSWASGRAGEESGLAAYLATWRHNDLAFGGLLALGLGLATAKLVVAAIVAAVVAALAARRADPLDGYAWSAAALLLLSPVLHPWYALGLLVALPVLSSRGPRLTAWALATAVLVTYAVPGGAGGSPGFRSLPLAVRVWELAPVLVVFALEAGFARSRARTARAPAPSGEEAAWSGRASARDS